LLEKCHCASVVLGGEGLDGIKRWILMMILNFGY